MKRALIALLLSSSLVFGQGPTTDVAADSTLQTKSAERCFYAVDYGVKADGLTNDTAALQAAIDAAALAATPEVRTTVVMPAGLIMVGRTTAPNTHNSTEWKHAINTKSNVNLVGMGMDVTTLRIITGTVGDTPLLDAKGEDRLNSTITNGSPNMTVTTTVGLCVGMPIQATGVPAGTVISSITNGTQLVMSANASASSTTTAVLFNPINMSFEEFTADVNSWVRFGTSPIGEGEAVNIKRGLRVTFRYVKAKNAEQDGFDLDGGEDLSLFNCVAEDNWGSGVHIVADGASKVLAQGCHFRRNGFGRRNQGTSDNGSGIDCSTSQMQVVGCVFDKNATEFHLLAGSAVLTGCVINHTPASTLFPSANTFPAVMAGWDFVGASGASAEGYLELNGCEIQTPSSMYAIEIKQAWPRFFLRNSRVYGKSRVLSGRDASLQNNFFTATSSDNLFEIVTATGKVLVLNNTFGNSIENYISALRVTTANNGVVSGNIFTTTGSGPVDVVFTNTTGNSDNWTIANNTFSTASSYGIRFSFGQSGHQIHSNTGSAGGFGIQFQGSCANNVIASNNLTNFVFSGSSDSGNVIENNNISGTITHSGTSTFAINTWRRNTGAGCAGIFYGTGTLASGTVTINSAAANSARKWGLTRQTPGASTGIGELALGTITAQTSFVVNSLNASAAVATGDVSTFYWEILE